MKTLMGNNVHWFVRVIVAIKFDLALKASEVSCGDLYVSINSPLFYFHTLFKITVLKGVVRILCNKIYCESFLIQSPVPR